MLPKQRYRKSQPLTPITSVVLRSPFLSSTYLRRRAQYGAGKLVALRDIAPARGGA
jgi:hypothetical protein